MSEWQGYEGTAVIAEDLAKTRRPKILVIDDDPNVTSGLKHRFHNYDVEVLEAYFGMHGLAVAIDERPDLIITDLKMPQGQGDHIIECLRGNSQTRHIPIIVLTGQSNNYLRRKLNDLGVDAYFTKPAAFEALREAVSQHIDLREKRNCE